MRARRESTGADTYGRVGPASSAGRTRRQRCGGVWSADHGHPYAGPVQRITSRLDSLRRVTISPQAYRAITVAALVALGAIIVTGAAVRLTESGMGCPTWPACEDGSLVPRGATGNHGWIEFGNRLVTGAVSVAVGVAVLGSLRRSPRSEEHTSELQSLMRISYAVFCLKKKKQNKHKPVT